MSQIYKNVTSRYQAIPKSDTVLIRGARQLITLRGPARARRGAELGDLTIIPDGALLLRGGRVAEAGPTRRVENLGPARDAPEINAAGRIVMPGFIDGRVQLWPEGLDRSRAAQGISALRARAIADRARRVLASMARHGTTTVCAATSAARDHSTELKLFRVLAALHGRPLDVLTAYVGLVRAESAQERATQLDAVCSEMLPTLRRRKLARFAVGDCVALEPAAVRRILECARNLGFPLRVWGGTRPDATALAVEMDALSISLDSVEEQQIGTLADARTIALVQPASQFLHRSERQSPARALIESGAAVALASGFGFEDGPTYNMQMVLSLACSEMGMSPAEAISAATINAAYALDCGTACGSLEPGKRADLIVLNVEDYRDLSGRFGINHVHMVLKNGAAIYREGEVSEWDGK